MIFHELAKGLLGCEKGVEHIVFESDNGKFGFVFHKGQDGTPGYPEYSGKMARYYGTDKVKRVPQLRKKPKLGLFDIKVLRNNRYPGDATHKHLILDILKTTTEDECIRVWRGENPSTVTEDVNKREALWTMALMMFEQEVNWGDKEYEVWQVPSHFHPKFNGAVQITRPRDMIMGFLRIGFNLGKDSLDPYWMRIKGGTTLSFGYSYSTFPKNLKQYFIDLEKMGGGAAVMVGDIVKAFREKAEMYPNNPWWTQHCSD